MTAAGGRSTSIAIWLLVACLLLLVFMLWPSTEQQPRQGSQEPPVVIVPPTTPEDPRLGIARAFVRAELLAPDLAVFPERPDAYHLTVLGQDRVQVSSYGMFQSMAGIRKNWFTVTMRYIGNGRYVLDGKGVETFEEGPKGLRQE